LSSASVDSAIVNSSWVSSIAIVENVDFVLRVELGERVETRVPRKEVGREKWG
jgi:hypothetical protein